MKTVELEEGENNPDRKLVLFIGILNLTLYVRVKVHCSYAESVSCFKWKVG